MSLGTARATWPKVNPESADSEHQPITPDVLPGTSTSTRTRHVGPKDSIVMAQQRTSASDPSNEITATMDEKGSDRVSTPTAEFSMTLKEEKIYLATLCWCLFMAGWNDGTLGPFLPRLQSVYHVSSIPNSGFSPLSLNRHFS